LRDLFVGPPEDRRLTMAELLDYVRGLPPDGALGRAMLGEAAAYTPEVHRLTDIADLLAMANWQRSGAPSSKRPKPIRRPRIPTDI
jgi:hypothetical protein